MKGGDNVIDQLLMINSALAHHQSLAESSKSTHAESFATLLSENINDAQNIHVIEETVDEHTVWLEQAKTFILDWQEQLQLDDLTIEQLSLLDLIDLLQELQLLAEDESSDVVLLDEEKSTLAMLLKQIEELAWNEDDVSHIQTLNSNYETIVQFINDHSKNAERDLQTLLLDIKRVLSLYRTNEDTRYISEQLLQFLQRWTSLTKEIDLERAHALIDAELNEDEANIWRHLVQTFSNRESMQKQNMYVTDTNITRQDVLQWLEHANERYALQSAQSNVAVNRHGFMTEVEQYDIHLQRTDRVERISNELVTKFEQIIRTSRFLQTPQTKQLSLMLKPDNLGNMTIRLVQANGEMTVKIAVTTQLAKEALEANIHQLKHLFAPHQITIERDPTISDEEFFGKMHEEEQEDEQQDKSFDEHVEEEANEDFDFEALISELQKEA